MMYRVEWRPQALDELATVWLGARDRNSITRATHRIDQRLQQNPADEGESRSAGRRILLEPPLGITYSIADEDRVVHILTVWSFERRGGSE